MYKMAFIGVHLRATYFELKLYALIPIQLTYNTFVYYFVNVIFMYYFSTKLYYKSFTIFTDIAQLQILLNNQHFLYNLVLKEKHNTNTGTFNKTTEVAYVELQYA